MKADITSDPDFKAAFSDQSSGQNAPSDLRVIVDTCMAELKALLDKREKRANKGPAGWNRLTEPFLAKSTQMSVEGLHRRCQVASNLVAINTAGEAKRMRREQQEWYGTERSRKILQWLSPLNFQERQRDILAKW